MATANEIIKAFEQDKEILQQLSEESKKIIIAACSYSEMDNHKSMLQKTINSMFFAIKLISIFNPSMKEVKPL